MKRLRTTWFVSLFLALIGVGILAAVPVLAQGVDMQAFAQQAGFGGVADIRLIIARLIRTFISFLGIIAVVLVLYGGFLWMTAGGDVERVAKAKRVLSSAVVGLVIILSSFAIAQFVLSALVRATGATIGSSPSGGQGGGYYGDGRAGAGQFTVSSFNDACAPAMRNFRPQFAFSQNVSSDSVNQDGALTLALEGGAPVPGSWSVAGKRVSFIPDAVCEGNTGERCLDADMNYTLTLNPALLRSAGGRSLVCSVSFPCSYTFHTGSGIDTRGPTLTMDAPENGASLSINSIELLQTLASDDTGVSTVEFFAEGESVYAAGFADSTVGALSPENYFHTDPNEQWSTAGLVPNQSYDLWATGSDCAGHESTASAIRVVVRAANCSNAVIDMGETGLNCGGDPAGENYCGACSGASCVNNAECSSGTCEAGVCVNLMRIDRVSPTDGAPGNLVTISGSGFGDVAGSIAFLGTETGDEVSTNPYTCNNAMQWTDTQIVVQVPAGAADGPVVVRKSELEADRTDDTHGPHIADFNVNDVVRPGLCAVDPVLGPSSAQLSVVGSNFGASQGSSTLYFGSSQAAAYPGWNADGDRFSVIVPRLDARSYDVQTFVGDNVCSVSGVACRSDAECGDQGGACVLGRQGSNTLAFAVTSVSSENPPVITLLDTGWTACENGDHCASDVDCGGSACSPASNWGPPGQTLTIFGSNFGTAQGFVRFVKDIGDEAIGDVEFPEMCGTDFWSDTSITVKVPKVYLNGNAVQPGAFAVRVIRAEDGAQSVPVDFIILNDTPGPSVCRLDPAAGPAGTPVTFTGEHFGSTAGSVTFFDQQPAAAVGVVWGDSEVARVQVPASAATGPTVVTASNGYRSNSANFEVGDCSENTALCTEGTQCCSDGTCRADCAVIAPRAAHYAYRFSTGPIPTAPRVIVACSADAGGLAVVSPSPWEGWSQSEDVCLNVVVTASFDTDMDQASFPANVSVSRCTAVGADPCAEIEVIEGSVMQTGVRAFAWQPSSSFLSATTYLVTLNAAGIRSLVGEPMAEDYSWRFVTTSDPAAVCTVGSVAVSPSETTATKRGTDGDVDYLAQPVAAEDQCLVLACDPYTFAWASSDAGAEMGVSPTCTNTVTPRFETPAGNPAEITAEITNVQTVVEGTAELTIDFTDPEVTTYWPSCDAACVNAGIGAEFNTAMDESALEAAGAVRLFSCVNALCETSLSEVVIPYTARYTDTDAPKVEILLPAGQALASNTFYRVVIAGSVTSDSGVSLSRAGSNRGSDFSWIFKTKDSDAVCSIERIDLEPNKAVMSYVGQRQEFDAVPFGAPDECSTSGQRLQADQYAWGAWDAIDDPNRIAAPVTVAEMLEAGRISLASGLAAGCSTSCLHVGTSVTAGQAVCGNSRVEFGEDCDSGDADDCDTPVGGVCPVGDPDSDGCSSACLTQPVVAVTCGNGVLEGNEECDDGDTNNANGCSNTCLNSGAAAVGGLARCGNGTVDYAPSRGGEECDDGNAQNGDGCSGMCLNEGSVSRGSVYARCGNGQMEAGEDCDDSNATDGDGCSAQCLHEGTSACVSECDNIAGRNCRSDADCGGVAASCVAMVGSCCGNGGAPQTGEDCDDSNTRDGDGCSSSCLKEGSSAYYATPSMCGDAFLDPVSEECEAAPAASFSVGPYAVSQITMQAPQEVEDGLASARVVASADGVDGSADLSLSCSCTSDLSCGNASVLGCGGGSCCYPRLKQTTVNPTYGSGNVCRNTAVWAEFDQPVDLASLDRSADDNDDDVIAGVEIRPQLYLRLDAVAGVSPANCPAEYIRMLNECVAPVNYSVVDVGNGSSRIYLTPRVPLVEKGTYILVVVGDLNATDTIREGVVGTNGVSIPLARSNASKFEVGTEICDLDVVRVTDQGITPLSPPESPSAGLFSRTGETHAFVTAPYTMRANGAVEEISEIPGAYEWTWSWGSSRDDAAADKNVVTAVSADSPSTTVSAAGQNGEEAVLATATISVDTLNQPSTAAAPARQMTGSTDITAFLCENAWPEYRDPDFNFSLAYCRDAGDPGLAEDLPSVTVQPVPVPLAGILQETLFIVDGTGDAMGVRIVSNPNYLPPDVWYFEQGFRGSPVIATLDGYQAVQDGATIYAAAANLASNDRLYSNIYIISSNADARPESQDIFEQILANWKFNANQVGNRNVITDWNLCRVGADFVSADGRLVSCQSDVDCAATPNAYCDGQKVKLTRDLRRLTDLVRMKERVFDPFGAVNRHCSVTKNQACTFDAQCPGAELCVAEVPELAAGSFIRAMTASTWPSWSAALGNAVGSALPIDPINQLAACPGEGFDPETCFNASLGQFVCSEGSHVYGYRSSGGEEYSLFTQLELNVYPWATPLDSNANTDKARLIAEFANPTLAMGGFVSGSEFCTGIAWGDSTICGDGLRGAGELICEVGDVDTVDCTTADGRPGLKNIACVNDNNACRFQTEAESVSACVLYACGNGVIDAAAGEECDAGALNGTYGVACSETCHLFGAGTFYCGDGNLAGGEQCDCGTVSTYAAVINNGQSWADLNNCLVSNGQYSTNVLNSCAFDCSAPGPSCGDRVVNGSEECDGNMETWAGALCRGGSQAGESCQTDSDCPDSNCGGSANTNACPASRYCESGQVEEVCEDVIERVCARGIGGETCSSETGRRCQPARSTVGNTCTSNAECGTDGRCSDFAYQFQRVRTCSDSSAPVCTWNTWNSCRAAAFCGNATIDGTEECDDGNDSDNDACTNSCRLNVCGDDFVYSGVESCDAGSRNGTACTASYGGTCNFCTASCQYQTRSGAFCGDGVKNGPEACDAADVPYRCLRIQLVEGEEERTVGRACDSSDEGVAGAPACDPDFTCRNVGMCNGGANNGATCTNIKYGSPNSTEDIAVCSGGSCVSPVCSSSCDATCPRPDGVLDTQAIQIRTEGIGIAPQNTVNLFSFENLAGSQPDNAAFTIPACTVAARLTADINKPIQTLPDLDLVIVNDLSSGDTADQMYQGSSSPVRTFVENMYATYAGRGRLRIALVSSSESLGISAPTATVDTTDVCAGTAPNKACSLTLGACATDEDCPAGTSGLVTDDWEGAVTNKVNEYASGGQTGGAAYSSLEAAIEVLRGSDADEKIVITLTQGFPGPVYGPGGMMCDLTAEAYGRWTQDDQCVAAIRDRLIDEHAEIKFYSVFLSYFYGDNRWRGFTAHLSSDDCGTNWDMAGDCDPNNGVEYYRRRQSDTLEDANLLMSSLQTFLTDLSISYSWPVEFTDPVPVSEGRNVELSLPAGFACSGSAFELPFVINFMGTDTATISNVNLQTCSTTP